MSGRWGWGRGGGGGRRGRFNYGSQWNWGGRRRNQRRDETRMTFQGRPHYLPSGSVPIPLSARDGNKVLVKGFPAGTNMEKLHELFTTFGEIHTLTMSLDNEGTSIASILYKSEESMRKVEETEQIEFDGEPLTIETFAMREKMVRQMEEVHRAMQAKPECVVYMKGLSPLDSDDAVREVLAPHGTITGILRRGEKEANHFIYILFGTNEEAQRVISQKTIEIAGKTVHVDRKWKKEELMEQRLQDILRWVHVTGFQADTTQDDIREALQACGEIQQCHIRTKKMTNSPYAFVEFLNQEAATACLEMKDPKIKDTPVSIQKRDKVDYYADLAAGVPQPYAGRRRGGAHGSPRMSTSIPLQQRLVPIHEVIHKMLTRGTLEEQMVTVVREYELNEEDYTKREELVNQLQELCRDFFPECEIQQFGSSVNGFGVRGADMDLYLDLKLDSMIPEEQLRDYPKKEVPFIADIPVLENKFEREKLVKCDTPERIKIVSRILSTHGKGLFNNFHVIPSVRCPVVKFLHVESSINIDLTVNNELALNNTRLMQFYSEYDARVRPLFYTIRFWAKLKEVCGSMTGSQHSGPRITNYTLALLVFHYLSTTNPPVLPTVADLASRARGTLTIDGWDCSLADGSVVRGSTNCESTQELLLGFFSYYASFDFGLNVIWARTASIMSRSDFDKEQEKDERLKQMKMGPAVVVDPFVLDHNTAQNVNLSTVHRFLYELQQACAKMVHENFNKPPAVDTQQPDAMATSSSSTLTGPDAISAVIAAAAGIVKSEPSDASSSAAAGVQSDPLPASSSVASTSDQPSSPAKESPKDWGLTFLISCQRVQAKSPPSTAELLQHQINLLSVAPFHLGVHMKLSDVPPPFKEVWGPEEIAKRWSRDAAQFVQLVLTDLMAFEFQDASELVGGELNTAAQMIAQETINPDADMVSVERKRIKLDSYAPGNIVIALKGATRYRLWQNRKALKKEIKSKTGLSDEYMLEYEVTKRLLSISQPMIDSVIEMYLTVTHEMLAGTTMVRVNLFPTIGQKEFSCFFPFFSSFISRLAEKSFTMKTVFA